MVTGADQNESPGGEIVHLRRGGCSLLLDARGPALPSVLHWGADLGHLDDDERLAVALAAIPPVVSNALDRPAPVSVLPEHSVGWLGAPGLQGHRGGADWSPAFSITKVTLTADVVEHAGDEVTIAAQDLGAALALRLDIALLPMGLLRMRATLRNEHRELPYTLDRLMLALPVPPAATELLDLTGRHTRERSPQRQPFTIGTRVRDNWRGRTGADATLMLVAGTPGFGFQSGEVWGIHIAWSGNHRTYAERLPSGDAVLGASEMLLPGEIRLSPGEEYQSPWIYASHGEGLDELSSRLHQYLRSRPSHPLRRQPRPVVLNTWEAVYFKHDLDSLKQLADAAAEVGVERFVLDDGWFRHRRDDTAGLGDWYVDGVVWPEGLHPLVNYVRSRGMEFGLWVEPEMVNPDSDLARAHADWILATGGRQPPLSRNQQVLDLGHPDAYAYIQARLEELLDEYDIGYLKWDHNRDLVDAGHSLTGTPGVHAQTLAVYRMLDELRARHPQLEIESCASGGARVDLGILERTDRVWASDTNDALERQSIQRWTALLLPPELIGAHVGPPRSHTTGRTHDLSFRAGTALFGHFGIEWNLTTATPEERAELRSWVACYKQLRHLLHSGRLVRADQHNDALWVHGVVAQDRAEAIFALVSMATAPAAPAGRIRLPGLDPVVRYEVTPLLATSVLTDASVFVPPWLTSGLTLTGRALSESGLQAPVMRPELQLLLHLKRHVNSTAAA